MLQKALSFIRVYRLPILSGIFIGTSYIPFPPWAYLFCFVPLWWFWFHEESLKKILIGGWVTQFLLTLIGFNWVAYVAHEFGRMPWAISIVVLLFYCALANLYVPIAGGIWWLLRWRFPQPRWLLLLLLPLCFALADIHLQSIFPWNYGYPWLWMDWPGYQVAEYIGFQGLSSVVIFLNLLLFLAFRDRADKFRAGTWVLLALGFLASLNLWGWKIEKALPPADAEARVLLVQANIGNQEKVFAEHQWRFRDQIVDTYIQLTQQGLNSTETPVDFAVWPETAFPGNLYNPGEFTSHSLRLKNFLKRNKVKLLTGGYGRDPQTDLSTNSMFMLDENGDHEAKHYSKTHLLAFGEYFPLAETFPVLREWIPEVGDFASGEGPTRSSFAGFQIGPQICYESLFPEFSQQLAQQGVEMIINVTNDSWYGDWMQPWQHLYMTLARGVEFRRPVIRSTNTGITTVGRADGKLMKQSPLHEEWFHVYTVPYRTKPLETFYQRNLHLIPGLLWGLMLTLLLFAAWWRAKERRSHNG